MGREAQCRVDFGQHMGAHPVRLIGPVAMIFAGSYPNAGRGPVALG